MPKPVLLLENFLPYRLSVLTNLAGSAIAGAQPRKAAALDRRRAPAARPRPVLRRTAAGRHIHAEVAPFALSYERSLLHPLSREERMALERALDMLLGRALQIGPLTKR